MTNKNIIIAALLTIGVLAIGQSVYALDYIHVPGTETIRANGVETISFHDSVDFRDQTIKNDEVRFTVVDEVSYILIDDESLDKCLSKKVPSNASKFIPNTQRISIHDSIDVQTVWYDVYDIRYVIYDGDATLISVDNVKTKCVKDAFDFPNDPLG